MAVLGARNIRKMYGGVAVLDDVSLSIRAGKMTGLVGENGAGKSTLIKILTGLVQANGGEVVVEGESMPSGWDLLQAREAGISVIHQELHLVPHLTVAENIMLGEPMLRSGWARRGARWIDQEANEERAREILDSLGIHDLDVRALVSSIGPGRAQVVLISRSLRKTGRVLILDEPTAALAPDEREELFALLQRLLQQQVGILFVSHHLQEVQDLCDDVLVLRNGRTAAYLENSDITVANMTQAMLDRSLKDQFPPVDHDPDDDIVLDVRNLSCPPMVRDISFTVGRGEILGITGLLGAGKTELARAVIGADPCAGVRQIAGKPRHFRLPRDGVRSGLLLVPEERKEQAIFPDLSVYENGIISRLNSVSLVFGLRRILTNSRHMHRAFSNVVEQLGISFAGEGQLASELSGGNQQKLVIGRALVCTPNVLVLDEPTRGVDVGSKREIYRIIVEEARRGLAVVLISGDTREVLAMSHRVLVMRDGEVVSEVIPSQTTNDDLIKLTSQSR